MLLSNLVKSHNALFYVVFALWCDQRIEADIEDQNCDVRITRDISPLNLNDVKEFRAQTTKSFFVRYKSYI